MEKTASGLLPIGTTTVGLKDNKGKLSMSLKSTQLLAKIATARLKPINMRALQWQQMAQLHNL